MQLIKGTYSKQDALEIVQKMIQVKIQFHEEKISISDNEEDIKMREKRIKDLQSDLSAFIRSTSSESDTINMDALLRMTQNQTETFDFSLINGTFSNEDSLEILNAAYQSKITFNKNKAFSMNERGKPGSQRHRARAIELQNELNRINALLQKNDKLKQKVNITCTIKLDFESVPETNVSEPTLVHSYKAS